MNEQQKYYGKDKKGAIMPVLASLLEMSAGYGALLTAIKQQIQRRQSLISHLGRGRTQCAPTRVIRCDECGLRWGYNTQSPVGAHCVRPSSKPMGKSRLQKSEMNRMFPDEQIVLKVSAQLSWSHFVEVVGVGRRG